MSNNLYEGIKIFSVCVCMCAGFEHHGHPPAKELFTSASQQQGAGRAQCASPAREHSQGSCPSPAQQPGAADPLESSKWPPYLLPEPRKMLSSGGCCSPPCTASPMAPVTVTASPARCSLTNSDRFHSIFSMPPSSSLWFTSFWYISAVLICKAKQNYQTIVSHFVKSLRKFPLDPNMQSNDIFTDLFILFR